LFENSLNTNTILGLIKWFKDYFEWLEIKNYDVNSHTNNIGTSYYLQIFVISKFIKPEADVEKYLAPMLNLLNSQFDSNGRQKEEIVRNKGVNYSLLNISYWISINNILEGNSKYK